METGDYYLIICCLILSGANLQLDHGGCAYGMVEKSRRTSRALTFPESSTIGVSMPLK